jgi:hypothetical protein
MTIPSTEHGPVLEWKQYVSDAARRTAWIDLETVLRQEFILKCLDQDYIPAHPHEVRGRWTFLTEFPFSEDAPGWRVEYSARCFRMSPRRMVMREGQLRPRG